MSAAGHCYGIKGKRHTKYAVTSSRFGYQKDKFDNDNESIYS
jgi:hypothetical protein